MENTSTLNPKWQAPKIVELQSENTASGDIHPIEVATTAGPS